MKLALITPAAKRQERRERLRNSRATALALRDVYPAVQHLRLDLVFHSPGPSTPAMQSHTLHAAARAFFEFPCPYADCDGQFDLSAAVQTAVADPTHRVTGELECSGKRAVGVGESDLCRLHLSYMVAATFKDTAAALSVTHAT
jgi:hypothetical protein